MASKKKEVSAEDMNPNHFLMADNPYLNDREKLEYQQLKRDFNIVKEVDDFDYVASQRFEVSRNMTNKVLMFSAALYAISFVLIAIVIISAVLKSPPDFYATTPSGKIYPLQKLN